MSVFAHDDLPLHPPLRDVRDRPMAVLVPADQVPEGVTVLGRVVLSEADRPGVPREDHLATLTPDREPGPAQGVRIDLDCRTAEVDGRELELTRLEFDLLALVIDQPYRVHSRRTLLNTLWDTAWTGGSSGTHR